ncbi:MAG: nucleotidyltransferase domain-containing protein [Bacteroidota bacterium]
MKFGLKEDIIKKIRKVFSEFPEINEAVLYGSRAKKNFRPGSDIDITLKGEELNLNKLNQISIKLDDLLLPYIFDLSLFHHIKNSELLEHIHRAGVLFYKKKK